MFRSRCRRIFAVRGVVFAALALAATSHIASTCVGPSDLYVSMGDSIAAGNGSSDPATTSFAALLAHRENVTLSNYAKAGSTTQRVIDEQLPAVLPVIASRRVSFITISAGGNDLAALIPNAACSQDPPGAACPLDDALAGVELRLNAIVRYLRAADGRVPIVLLAVPNLFSGTGHPWEAPAGRVLPRLAETMQRVAAKYEHVAVATPNFDGRGDELTHINDEVFDPHPNDAGHRVIADAMASALSRARR